MTLSDQPMTWEQFSQLTYKEVLSFDEAVRREAERDPIVGKMRERRQGRLASHKTQTDIRLGDPQPITLDIDPQEAERQKKLLAESEERDESPF